MGIPFMHSFIHSQFGPSGPELDPIPHSWVEWILEVGPRARRYQILGLNAPSLGKF